MSGATVWITYNLRDAGGSTGQAALRNEESDHPSTIESLSRAIEHFGHRAEAVGDLRALLFSLVREERKHPDLVFNISVGEVGRSRVAQLPAILEALSIPCTFSDSTTLAITQDKSLTEHLLRAHGILVPDSVVADIDVREDDLAGLKYPVIVKPLAEGTSLGVSADSIAQTATEAVAIAGPLARLYGTPVIVDEYIAGREFTVAVLGSGADARALGAMEVILKDPDSKVYGLLKKENSDSMVDYRALSREEALFPELAERAVQVHRVFGCRDTSRTDFRLSEDGGVYCLDVNPIPGLNPGHSDLPMIAANADMSYTDLIGHILSSALSRAK